MRFDWYSATYPGDPRRLWECLQDARTGLTSSECRPHHGYGFAKRFEGSGGLLVTTQWGGRQDSVHAFASGAGSHEFWGAAKWTQELVRQVLDMDVRRVEVGSVWRPADDDRAYRHMVSQYGAMLSRLAVDLGSWDCVGATIGHDVQAMLQLKRTRRT